MKMPGYIAFLMAIISLMLTGCDSTDVSQTDDPPLAVSVEPLKPVSQFSVEHRYAGQVTAAQSSALGFETGGTLEQVLVDTGDRVTQGQRLAQLDTRLLQREADRLRAQRQEISARLSLARKSLQRLNSLEPQGFASRQRQDELEAETQALRAALEVSDAALAQNWLQQDKAVLTAPFDARVGKRLADQGTVLAAGQPVLQLLTRDQTEILIGVPAQLAQQMQVGARYTVEVEQQRLNATLIQIGAELNPASRTLSVRLQPVSPLEQPQGTLAHLVLEQVQETQGFRVPISALTDSVRGLWQVYVLNGENRVEARDVRILHTNATHAFIEGALAPDERLITSGLHRVVPGQTAAPAPRTSAGAAQP
ncbi:efflux RND transporter periplasmic adaptor subunit [Marinobacterium sp. AK62]|uniref:Efflux RND transporter periplasmic adaptor subunit n=1 Tax=Marinobacterium alkalitolerans TaxID=1542925 RepID=A0ABS3Z6H0_9GAMM|nr:efflux RND transporter periplasmic adaptor subunit [Marinobacterium alkalitolerans]MBP0047316.1 efflux RND transporter periplasmic adaptor subunit [Marinobacterium alkalitolerans]